MIRCRVLLTWVVVAAAAAATAGAEDAKEADGRLRVAIMRFDVGKGVSIDADTFTDALSTTLAKQGNFVCIERRRLSKVIDEKDFRIAIGDTKRVVELAKLLGADALLYGSVGHLGGEYVAVCHMVDVRSGKVLVSSGARCKGGGSLTALAAQVAGEILAAFPPEGFILKLQKDASGATTATIDLGKGRGITTRSKLVALDEQVMTHPRTKKTIHIVRKLGVLQPSEIEQDFTTAKVPAELAAKLKTGQRIRAITPVQQIKRAAMRGETFDLAVKYEDEKSPYLWCRRWKPVIAKVKGHLARNLYGTTFRVLDLGSGKTGGGQPGPASGSVDLVVLFSQKGHRPIPYSRGDYTAVLTAKLMVMETGEVLAGCSRETQTTVDGSAMAKDVVRMLHEWYGRYQKGKLKDKN